MRSACLALDVSNCRLTTRGVDIAHDHHGTVPSAAKRNRAADT
jgi:hypothetical protein